MAVAFLIVLASASLTDARSWTNRHGLTFQAEFVRVTGDMIVVKQNGETLVLNLSDLSEQDQEWVNAKKACQRSRAWTTRSGSAVRGRYRKLDGDAVLLDTPRGRKRLPLSGLCDEDRRLMAVLNDLELRELPAAIAPENQAADSAAGRAAPPPHAEEREWTAADGRKIVAQYRGVEGLKVVLFYKDREWRVPLRKLSTDDQRFLESMHAKTDAVMFDDLEAYGAEEKQDGAGADDEPRRLAADSPDGTAAAAERWDWDTLKAEFDGYSVRVSTTNGRSRAWVDNAEVFGEKVDRVKAYIAMNEKRTRSAFGGDPARSRREDAERAREEITPSREERRREREARREERRRQAEAAPTNRPSKPAFEPGLGPTPPIGPLVNAYVCYSCDKEFESVRELKAGDKCPHCGVTFDYMEDENGEVIDETASSKARRAAGLVKLVIVGGVAFVSLLGWVARKMS